MIDINAKYSKIWPILDHIKPPPEDAERWKDVPNKIQYLEE